MSTVSPQLPYIFAWLGAAVFLHIYLDLPVVHALSHTLSIFLTVLTPLPYIRTYSHDAVI